MKEKHPGVKFDYQPSVSQDRSNSDTGETSCFRSHKRDAIQKKAGERTSHGCNANNSVPASVWKQERKKHDTAVTVVNEVSPARRKRKRRKSDAATTIVNETVDQICEQCNSGLHGGCHAPM
jgi:hypothetical protein